MLPNFEKNVDAELLFEMPLYLYIEALGRGAIAR